VVDARGAPLAPGHAAAGAACEQVALEPGVVEQAIVAAQVVARTASVDDDVGKARAEQMRQPQVVDLVAPDAVGVGPGRLRVLWGKPADAQPGVGQRRSQRHARRPGSDDEYVVHVCNQGR
jgi:hypothetical protein